MIAEMVMNGLRRDAAQLDGFPLEVFPQKVQSIVLDWHAQDDYPPEFSASAMLSAASTAIGNSYHIHIRGGWVNNPSLFMVLVGPPSLGKTPPLQAAFAPIQRLDIESIARYCKAREEGVEKKPVLAQVILDDFTPEAMIKVHSDNPKGVVVKVDEFMGMINTVNRYNSSNLIELLLTAFSGAALKKVRVSDDKLLLYKVGTSKAYGGSTVFWQVDHMGQVKAGKVIGYDPKTGHRVKDPKPQVAWVHSLMGIKMELRECLFGEHLLRQCSTKQVVIVESEKSALICAWKMPQYIWLATGGLYNLKPSEALRGRDVILIPDLGAEESWREKMEQLKPICKSVTLSESLTKMATDDQKRAGLDIADFLLTEPTAGMVIEQMKQLNPELADFILALQLTPISTSEGLPNGLRVPEDSDNSTPLVNN
ncbi:MAG: DUF3987 domain-containing protein [Bacteroidales bacterium]|nr:DUF3987 domain-containing protein [Bacteroidales bacterium]